MPRPETGGASSRPGTLSTVNSSSVTTAGRTVGASAIVASAVVVAMIVAFVPVAEASGWSPRAFVALAALPWAVIALARLVRAGDLAARASAALIAAAILAVTFFPTFYSRLALRAIMLPVLSGLAAYFYWRGWEKQGARRKA